MKKLWLQIVVFTAAVGLMASLTGCCSMVKSCLHQVLILHQPQSQTVITNADATFSVYALGGPPFTTSGLSYQWQFNGTVLDENQPNLWVNLSGQTGPSLTIHNVQLNNVGFYRVLVSGSDKVTSDPASLQALLFPEGGTTHGGGPITVAGLPIVRSSSSGNCPGSYAGYVYYTNTTSWGWAPINANNPGLAADAQSGSTKVQAVGYYGDHPCNTGPVTVPATILSPQYQFYIYFPTGTTVPSGSYKINLTNFH